MKRVLAFASLLLASASFAKEPPQKFVRFQVGEDVRYGLLEGNGVREIVGDLFGSWNKGDKSYPLKGVKLLVPTTPSKVIALAGNYRSHVGNQAVREHPEIFYKLPSCLIPSGADIVFPPGASEVHYEAELVIVIGKRAKNVPQDQALNHVLGVTCGNDVSERKWQKGDIQWWRAKGSDTFGPCGPVIVSGIDYDHLDMKLRVNDTTKLETNTSEMVHNVAQTVSWISNFVTLEPGDLIYTGTAGVTQAIKPGDVVEVEIEGVGILTNPVVDGR